MAETVREPGGPRTARRLRLLLFCHSPNLGGSEQVLLGLARELTAERDVACTVVVPGSGPLPGHLRAAGVQVWDWALPWWAAPRKVEPAGIRRKLAAGAAEVMSRLDEARELDPDAVLSITTVAPWGGLTAALLGKPHLWYVTDFGRESADPLEYFLPFDRVRHALRAGSDRVLVVSEAVRDRLFADGGEPPPVVYPHLEVPAGPAPAPAPPQPSGVSRVAVFGNLRPAKGQWDAVTAVARLARRGVDAELVLVGPAGPGEPDLEAHARSLGVAERVRVLGHVEDQHPWMKSADVVLVPSHEETLSLVALEALLHEKPLVATRVGGLVELVSDGISGLTVPARDPDALADALESLIWKPDLARRLAAQGRERARSRFTADGFSGAVRAMLDEVAAAGRRCSMPAALLAPLEALAEAYRDQDAERIEAQALRTEIENERSRWKQVEAKLEQASSSARTLRTEVQRLSHSVRLISGSRAWRLVRVYWRLAERIKGRG